MTLSAGREVAALRNLYPGLRRGAWAARRLATSLQSATKNVNQLTGFRLAALAERVAKGHGR
jgi:hypothetical protein